MADAATEKAYALFFHPCCVSKRGLREVKPSELQLFLKCKSCGNSFKVKIEWIGGEPDFEKEVKCKCPEILTIREEKPRVEGPDTISSLTVTGNFKFTRKNLTDENVKWKSIRVADGEEVKFNTVKGEWKEEGIDDKGKTTCVNAYCSGASILIFDPLKQN